VDNGVGLGRGQMGRMGEKKKKKREVDRLGYVRGKEMERKKKKSGPLARFGVRRFYYSQNLFFFLV
jgi:hypothetical protein